nr:hypothetical protein [signal crayfish associated chu-like virus 1]
MAKFFRKDPSINKNNEAVTRLTRQSMVGLPFGWIPAVISSGTMSSDFSLLDDSFVDCKLPYTDYQMLIAFVHLTSVKWVKKYTSQYLSSGELEVVYMACNLLATWRCVHPLTLTDWDGLVTLLGSQLSEESKQALAHELVEEWTELRGPVLDTASRTEGDDSTHLLCKYLLPIKQDQGFYSIEWTAQWKRVLDDLQELKNSTLFPFLPTAATVLTEAVMGDNLDFKRGIIFLHRYSRKHDALLKAIYGKSIMLFVSSIIRISEDTDVCLRKRKRGLEEGMRVGMGTIGLGPHVITVFKDIMRVWDLNKHQIYDGLGKSAVKAMFMNVERVQWMVAQAAYTGMKIITSVLNVLTTYDSFPLEFLLGDMVPDITQFLNAAMFGYLYPYSGLMSIKYPATKFPTLATLIVRICKEVFPGTFSKYERPYTGANTDKVYVAYNTFCSLRNDLMARDTIMTHLGKYMGDSAPNNFRTAYGHIVVTSEGTQAAEQSMPSGMNESFYNLCTNISPNFTEFTIPVRAFLELIKSTEKTSPTTHESIKLLYKCIWLLKEAYEDPPCDSDYTPSSFERSVPQFGDGDPLSELAIYTNAIEMKF